MFRGKQLRVNWQFGGEIVGMNLQLVKTTTYHIGLLALTLCHGCCATHVFLHS